MRRIRTRQRTPPGAPLQPPERAVFAGRCTKQLAAVGGGRDGALRRRRAGAARRPARDRLPADPARPAARARPRVGPPPAKEVAERLAIEVRQPERLAGFEPDADAVVVVAYGALIPEELLDRALWLNVHPSLLPRWRGAAPVERAIMDGDRETGVTIHRTTAELDAGPIAAQQSFPIEPEDDAGAIYARAAPVAAELLEGVLAEPVIHAAAGRRRDLRSQDHGRRPRDRLVEAARRTWSIACARSRPTSGRARSSRAGR